MRNLLLAVSLALVSSWTLAANMEEAAKTPSVEAVSVAYVALFVILFIGGIVGFIGYLVWNDKRNTRNQQTEPE